MTNKNTQPSQDEVDLGNIFIIIGKGFQKLFAFIGLIFKSIYDFLVILLIHIFKRKWWYLTTLLIGLALGIYFDQTKEKLFEANLYVQTNFDSAAEVYENVNYLNQLSKSKNNFEELKQKLNLTTIQAKALKGFSIEPIINENEIVELYSNFKNELDSLSQENLVYDEYKKSLTDFNYKKHKIEILSTNQFVFKKLGENLSKALINNEYLEKVKTQKNKTLQEEINNLDRLEKQVDSLVNVYLAIRQIEVKKPNANTSGTNLYMAEANPNTLLVDESKLIFSKTNLKQKKTYLTAKLLETDNVVNLYGQLPEAGYEVSGALQNKILITPILFFLITLFVFSALGLYNFLAQKVKV